MHQGDQQQVHNRVKQFMKSNLHLFYSSTIAWSVYRATYSRVHISSELENDLFLGGHFEFFFSEKK